MKLDSTWNKSYETFLHTWSTRLYDLESIRDEEVSYNDKKRWLINSIKSHAALYQGVNTAKSVEQTVKAMAGGKELIWDQFFNLILDHAQNLDSTMPTTTRRKTNQGRRQGGSGKQGQKGQNEGQKSNTTTTHSDYIAPEKWRAMSPQEKKKIIERRKNKRGVNRAQQANNAQGAPTTVAQGNNQGNNQAPLLL
jgi:hypothetical protein